MEQITYFTQQSQKKNIPDLKPGDTVRVHQKIREGNKERIQIFEGIVMAVRGNKSINASFVVRRIASGVGVEKTFPLHSPNVVKVERVKSSKVRQARLYYLRDRHGRASRMTGETRDGTSWDDSAIEEPSTEETDQNENLTEEEAVTEPEESNDTSETPTDTPAEESQTKTEE